MYLFRLFRFVHRHIVKQDCHIIAPAVKHAANVNIVPLCAVEYEIVSADKKAVIRFHFYDTGQ